MDIKTAFFYGLVEEIINITQFTGLCNPEEEIRIAKTTQLLAQKS